MFVLCVYVCLCVWVSGCSLEWWSTFCTFVEGKIILYSNAWNLNIWKLVLGNVDGNKGGVVYVFLGVGGSLQEIALTQRRKPDLPSGF